MTVFRAATLRTFFLANNAFHVGAKELNHLILTQRKMVETLSTSIELLKSSAFAPNKSKSAYLR